MNGIVSYLRSRDSERQIVELIVGNIRLYQAIDTERKFEDFSGSLYNHFVRECVSANQFLALSKDQYGLIHELYRELIRCLRELSPEGETSPEGELAASVRGIVRRHRGRLIGVLEGLGDLSERGIVVPCAEYSAEFQRRLLRLGPDDLVDPILDIGCGRDCALVRSLAAEGREAYGIDQYYSGSERILRESWLDFIFLPEAWGTIVSHMAFSNHLRSRLAFRTEELGAYERTYREILESLKPGSKFIYAPALPELEVKLDPARFEVERFPNIEGDAALDTVHLRRLRP